MISPTSSDSFNGESFTAELLYDGEVILSIDVQNAVISATNGTNAVYVPFVVVPSKGIYKIVNSFILTPA